MLVSSLTPVYIFYWYLPANTTNSTFCKTASILLAPIHSLHHSQPINDIKSCIGMVLVQLMFSTTSPHKFSMFVFHSHLSDFAIVVRILVLRQCPDVSYVPSEQQALVFPIQFSFPSLAWVLFIFSPSAEKYF